MGTDWIADARANALAATPHSKEWHAYSPEMRAHIATWDPATALKWCRLGDAVSAEAAAVSLVRNAVDHEFGHIDDVDERNASGGASQAFIDAAQYTVQKESELRAAQDAVAAALADLLEGTE